MIVPSPTLPAPYDDADIAAMQAMARGDATQGQQVRALKWIVETLCDAYGLSYRPESTHETAFAEGKRHVGLQIIKLTKIPL